MAFCGQCGLLLNPNSVNCPRCGTMADFSSSVPGAPANDNSATVIANIQHTPPPPDTRHSAYPESGAVPPILQSGNNYPTPGAITPPVYPQNGSNYGSPGYMHQGVNQAPTPGVYAPNTYPGTDPNYPYPPQIPPRKTRKWPMFLAIFLVLLFLIGTSATIFAIGPDHIIGLFSAKNTPISQSTAQPATTPQVQDTPTTEPSPTVQPSPTTSPIQQAQATIQQYYDDINGHNYQGAYDLWVNYSDTSAHFQEGFAHTHNDAITFGAITQQTDGTVVVNLTLQSTEDAASGTGTQVSTYQGYYIVGQQAYGGWKILNAKFNRV